MQALDRYESLAQKLRRKIPPAPKGYCNGDIILGWVWEQDYMTPDPFLMRGLGLGTRLNVGQLLKINPPPFLNEEMLHPPVNVVVHAYITRKCRTLTLWGRSWARQLLWLHAHEQTKIYTEMMSWITSVYECRLCTTLNWSDLNPLVYTLYSQRAACRGWLVHSCCGKQEVRCRACLSLSHLCYGCCCCTLAVAQHHHCTCSAQTRSRTFEIFKRAFKIYSIWPQANKYVTNTLPQCSPTSVGLAQARPNYFSLSY